MTEATTKLYVIEIDGDTVTEPKPLDDIMAQLDADEDLRTQLDNCLEAGIYHHPSGKLQKTLKKITTKKPAKQETTPMTKEERAAARAAKRPAKPDKTEAKAKAPKAEKKMPPKKPARYESDSETIRKIVELASRKHGATRKELEEASGWVNAGWPWMFYNPKTGKGIAPRYGMKFEVIERPAEEEGGRSYKAYKLSKLPKEAKAA